MEQGGFFNHFWRLTKVWELLGKKELATLGAAFRSALKQKCLELEEKPKRGGKRKSLFNIARLQLQREQMGIIHLQICV